MDDSPIAPACSAFALPDLFSLTQSLRRREGIATYCIAHGLQLLHVDRDFEVFEKQLGLNAVGR
jgi:predicted nucleic acid-binding protein